ncbi:MAG: hypothetical protein J0651_00525, partial [Actinobacteria bacterium]|nr:hypothetical protein [Actinomycetota bacterium]
RLAGPAGQVQQIDMSVQIKGMIAPLHQLDRNVSDLLARIGHDGDALTQDIETTIQSITVHEKISGEIRKVTLELESMVEKMRALCPALVSDSDRKEMANMTDRYTMEREREIHESIAGAAVVLFADVQESVPSEIKAQEVFPEPEAQETLPDEEAGEDLGDNVELF